MFSDLHCALGTKASFTDPVSNWVSIFGLDMRSHLAKLVLTGRYPPHLMPAFIHECVHHSCFNSLTGSALALLQMRATRKLLRISLGDDSDRTIDSALDDIARYEVAVAIMRPLAEGLALYGEFDAFSGNARIVSHVSLLAGINFAGDTKPGSIESLARGAMRHRTCSWYIERKADLLAQPLSTLHGGYLPGYLALKNLWHSLIAREKPVPEVLDTDLFWLYARNYFYEDYGMAEALLSGERHLHAMNGQNGYHDSVDYISRYLQRRIASFPVLTTRDRILAFEDLIASKDVAFRDHLDLGVDAELAARGKSLIDRELEVFENHPSDASDLEKKLLNQQARTLNQRHVLCIGSFSADVTVNEYERVVVAGIDDDDTAVPTAAMPSLRGIQPCKGVGTVEVFVKVEPYRSALIVTLQGKTVAVMPITELSAGDLSDFEALKAGLADFLLARKTFAEIAERVLASEPAVDEIHKYYVGEATRITEEIYRNLSTARVPEKLVNSFTATMLEHGFYSILDEDAELVRALATYSMLTPIAAHDPKSMKDLFERIFSAYTYESFLERIGRATARFGFHAMLENKRLTLCFV